MSYGGHGGMTGCGLCIAALPRWSISHNEEVEFLRFQDVLCLIAALAEDWGLLLYLALSVVRGRST